MDTQDHLHGLSGCIAAHSRHQAHDQGRRMYANVRKFIRYVLTGNVGEITAVALASLFGLSIPLLPIQIL